MRIDLKNMTLIPMMISVLLIIQMVVSFFVFEFLMPLSYLTLGLCIMSFLFMAFVFFRRPLVSLYDLVLFIFFLLLISFSFIAGTDLKNSIFRSIEVWLLLLLFNYYQDRVGLLLKSMAFSLSCCIYANLLLMVMFPDWMLAADDILDCFLLGGNYNQMGCRFLIGIVTNILCIKYGRKWLINTIVVSLVSIVTLLMVGSMTSLSVITIFILCCLIPSVRLQKLIVVGYFVFYVLFHVFVVFSGESLHNNEFAVYIIEDVLGKDITFTNRTGMWDAALRVIEKSPVIGYGLVDKDWYMTNMSTFAIGPHNFVLALLIYGGGVLFLLFCSTCVIALQRISGHVDRFGVILLLACMSLLFMMAFEVYPPFFIIFILTFIYYYPQIQASWNHQE